MKDSRMWLDIVALGVVRGDSSTFDPSELKHGIAVFFVKCVGLGRQ